MPKTGQPEDNRVRICLYIWKHKKCYTMYSKTRRLQTSRAIENFFAIEKIFYHDRQLDLVAPTDAIKFSCPSGVQKSSIIFSQFKWLYRLLVRECNSFSTMSHRRNRVTTWKMDWLATKQSLVFEVLTRKVRACSHATLPLKCPSQLRHQNSPLPLIRSNLTGYVFSHLISVWWVCVDSLTTFVLLISRILQHLRTVGFK